MLVAANPAAGAEPGRLAFGNTALCARQDCGCSLPAAFLVMKKESKAQQSNPRPRLGSSALLIGFCSLCWVAGEVSKYSLTQLVIHELSLIHADVCALVSGGRQIWAIGRLVGRLSRAPASSSCTALRCPPRAWLPVPVALCVVRSTD
ncbi:uncharacterized protein [Triticum aestivum]|uniref:uncharacterized protein n=1 Tax=Triticum aestivum TaxID=4565 RepID=UPI001D01A32B|nr:uncharacterized protein LOC123146054 [Triticum aestivum]